MLATTCAPRLPGWSLSCIPHYLLGQSVVFLYECRSVLHVIGIADEAESSAARRPCATAWHVRLVVEQGLDGLVMGKCDGYGA